MNRKNRRAKKTSKLKHVKKRAVQLFLTVGIISTLALLGYGVYAARNILQPIATFASSETTIAQDSQSSQFIYFTITLNENNEIVSAALCSFDEDETTIKSIVIPSHTTMHLPYGLKEFKLQSLYKIAELERPNNPTALVNQTLIEYFGVGTKNIFILKNTPTDQPLHKWLSSYVNMFQMTFNEAWTKEHLRTNFSPWELLSLARKLQAVPEEHVTTIDLVEAGIGTITKDIDGSQIIATDQNKLDTSIKKAFQYTTINEERANVVIENATDTTGLGNRVARMITNMGGIVVEVRNSSQNSNQSMIEINDKKWVNSDSVQKIMKLIPDIKIEQLKDTDKKADIVLKVGTDYSSMISGK